MEKRKAKKKTREYTVEDAQRLKNNRAEVLAQIPGNPILSKTDEEIGESIFGRPSKYEERFAVELFKHMGSGYSFESFLATLNSLPRLDENGEPLPGPKVRVGRTTMYEWLDKYEDFSYARECGKTEGLKFMENMGLLGSSEHQKINARVWEFMMQNLHGWTKRQDVKSDGKAIGNKVQVVVSLPSNGREVK